MIHSMVTIGGHLVDRILCDARGSPLTLPTFYPGLYQFRLKIFDKDPSDQSFQVFPNITSMSASIGLIYAEPRAGSFTLRYGTGAVPQTAPIDFNENAEDFRTKLAALADSGSGTGGGPPWGLDVVYQPTPSTWVCRFLNPSTSTPIPLNCPKNDLEPETFVRVREFSQNNETWVEVRLMQGPVASTNDHSDVLANLPSVVRIRAGHTEDNGIVVILIDEIQAITVPPDFTGTYFIKYQQRESVTLSVNSGIADIEDAINNMYGDETKRFVVTNPELNRAYVEFVGPFAGLPMDLLEIVVTAEMSGKPDTFFELDLNTTEVAEALTRHATVDASFEVRMHLADPSVIEDVGQDITLFQAPVKITRPLHWDGLEEAAPIDWLQPPTATDYIPFTMDQIIRGTLTYSMPFGNGTATSYNIAHDLHSDALTVEVRENRSDGRKLRDDEYTVNFVDDDSLTIVRSPAPATDSLLAMIFSVGPVDAFLAHHHTIAQIDGLTEMLAGILGRLTALEDLFATLIPPGPGSVFGVDPEEEVAEFDIKDEWDLIPTNRPPATETFDPKKLAPAGLLLPAIHDVIGLGSFTVDTTANTIILGTSHAGLVAGQRARIDAPVPYDTGIDVTFTIDTNVVNAPGHNLVNGRQVKFTGAQLPASVSSFVIYYVINSVLGTSFKISLNKGGVALAFSDAGDIAPHSLWTIPEAPGGLKVSVDYFMLAPTTTTFQLSRTIGGTFIDITNAGFPPYTMSSVEEAPSVGGILPAPGPANKGQAYSVRENIYLPASVGIRSETVHAGDLVASDGRVWYHVTRSDSPGVNSFYAMQMEKEIFRLAVSDTMLPASGVFTLVFDIWLQMFKHDTNVQYMLVVEVGDLLQVATPAPTGPNLLEVDWNTTPLLQQRIIVTDIKTKHKFGAQVAKKSTGIIISNKKLYGVELSGDAIPLTTNFAIRVRLIEFDTEDNVFDANGLIYYTMEKAEAHVSGGSPVAPASSPVP